MFKKAGYFLLVIGIMAVITSCNSYKKVLKTGNNELKYETAIDLYEKGDFNKAIEFFDILGAVYRGTEEGETITYYRANCYFQTKDYNIAAYYYKQYVQTYPRGVHAEEAMFLSAYSNYLQSPRISLDQTSTYIALAELQNFIDMYPNSTKITEANRLMDNLRQKLETKSYNISKLYYRMEDYQAAITSFENLIDDFPDTDYKEEILYFITIAYYEYAEKSIYTKKEERYEMTIESYNNLLLMYPESEFLKDAGKANDDAKDRLRIKR